MAGHLYDGDFDPTDSDRNLISQADKSDGPEQFRITTSLQPGHRYVLVVRPQAPETTGEFSIVSSEVSSLSTRTRTTIPALSSGEYRFVNCKKRRYLQLSTDSFGLQCL